MKLGVLFSGGKDSTYAGYLARLAGHELVCLGVVHSKNLESYMFHTPSISKTEKQAEVMDLPLVVQETEGEKEDELKDLKTLIKKMKDDFGVEGVVTGAIQSVYQASRVQKICSELRLWCFNPLWQKDEVEYLNELIKEGFEVIVVGVYAYPLDKSWLGKKIDKDFIKEVKVLKEKYDIHPAGEGGEFETFVLNCPMFSQELKVVKSKIIDEGEHSARIEVELK